MFNNTDNVNLLYIREGYSTNSKNITRKQNALLCRTNGQGKYFFNGKEIITNEGSVIFMPKNICYSFEVIPETECKNVTFCFQGDFKDAKPKIYSLDGFNEKYDLYNNLANWWISEDAYKKYKSYAMFYNLLAHLSFLENTEYATSHYFNLIVPAEEYLQSHLFDCNLKTDMLHTLCGISAAYFRKIFHHKFGISANEYIINKRLSFAKNLLENGYSENIKDLSLSVGYNDPLYFSRAFKKKYGISPTNIGKV